jgi:DNA-binding NarL/FixJ family response regulator
VQLIRLEKSDLPILILTLYSEAQYGMRALRAGASGYLTKGSAPDDLVVAIRKVVEGGAYVSPALALQLAHRLKYGVQESLHELLSNRELTVLCAIARGKQLAQIASELHLSAKTVTTYRSRVLEKLGKHSNTELALYAAEHGLIGNAQEHEGQDRNG